MLMVCCCIWRRFGIMNSCIRDKAVYYIFYTQTHTLTHANTHSQQHTTLKALTYLCGFRPHHGSFRLGELSPAPTSNNASSVEEEEEAELPNVVGPRIAVGGADDVLFCF